MSLRDDRSFSPVDNWWVRGGKRCADLLVATVIAAVAAPIVLVSSVLVKLEDGDDVFFWQERVGAGGRAFRIPKIRTMSSRRSHDAFEVVTSAHPDVTRVGRWLRRLKVDELPQIWNVLVGEMSLVGPRPTVPEQVARYDDYQRRRLLVRPGCTGLAQVHGNASLSWDERIAYDVYYVAHCSMRMDIFVLARTVAVVLLGEEKFRQTFADSRYAREGTSSVGGGRR